VGVAGYCCAVALLLPECCPAAATARRIVSTSPGVTEILYALGLGDRVVGVTNYCRYPAEASRKPRIGTFLEPNLEVIAALRPDLVVIIRNPVDLAGRLKQLGLNAFEVDTLTVDGIYRATEEIAARAGAAGQGRALVASLRSALERIRRSTASGPRRPMVFIVGRTPGTLESLVAAGKASYLGELIEIAGGRNIFRDAVSAYPRVSLETILARNPEVIVDMGDFAHVDRVTEQDRRRVLALWRRYPVIAAVRDRRVHAVASDIFVVPGPRMVEAARAFARMLHPETAP